MPTNEERAHRAEIGILEYYERSWERCTEHRQQALGDLLCDLQHFADMYGLDFDEALRCGRANHEAELIEEDGTHA